MRDADRSLIVHVLLRFDIGGLENGIVHIINGLPESKYRHAVICIDDCTSYADRVDRSDVEFISIHKRPGTDMGAILRLFRHFARLKPDIVHTRNLAGLDGLLPAFLARVPYRIHGEHGWDINDVDGLNRKLQLIRKLHRPLVNTYVALSKNIRNYLEEKVGVAPEKIVRLCNGVDTERFVPASEKNSVRNSLGMNFPDDAVVIGTVGRLTPVKNQLLLVDAFEKLVADPVTLVKPIRLVIVGNGELQNEIKVRLERANLTALCWFPGSRSDVPQVMQSLDVFSLPSLAEGISNTILEAMASGLPVVASDVGGNAELVSQGKTGVLLTAADSSSLSVALRQYIEDKSLREQHGRAARLRAEKEFSIRSMIAGYDRLYAGYAGNS